MIKSDTLTARSDDAFGLSTGHSSAVSPVVHGCRVVTSPELSSDPFTALLVASVSIGPQRPLPVNCVNVGKTITSATEFFNLSLLGH